MNTEYIFNELSNLALAYRKDNPKMSMIVKQNEYIIDNCSQYDYYPFESIQNANDEIQAIAETFPQYIEYRQL